MHPPLQGQPLSPYTSPTLCRSDPLHEAPGEADSQRQTEFMSVEWKPNLERGCSFYFGYRAIRRFLDDNDLVCLVRAHQVRSCGRMYCIHSISVWWIIRFGPHLVLRPDRHTAYPHLRTPQVQEEGYKRHFYTLDKHALAGSPLTSSNVRQLLPPVITIFSAPNYCDRYGNRAAFLRIGAEPHELSFEQFDCVPAAPSQHGPSHGEPAASAHNLAFIRICPYMPTTVRDLFRVRGV